MKGEDTNVVPMFDSDTIAKAVEVLTMGVLSSARATDGQMFAAGAIVQAETIRIAMLGGV